MLLNDHAHFTPQYNIIKLA